MIVLCFPALPLYTRERTIDEQTVLIALNWSHVLSCIFAGFGNHCESRFRFS